MNKTISSNINFSTIIKKYKIHQQISKFMDKINPISYNL
jgi:hypothetical protein